MADEMKDGLGASSVPPSQNANASPAPSENPLDQVNIVSETIIRRSAPSGSIPRTENAIPPLMRDIAPPQETTRVVPPEAPAPEKSTTLPQQPVPQNNASMSLDLDVRIPHAVNTPPTQSAPVTPLPGIRTMQGAQETPVDPRMPAPEAPPKSPPSAPTIPPRSSSETSITRDMTNIIASAKLPERHEFKAAGDAPTAPSAPIAPQAEEPRASAPPPAQDPSRIVPVHTLKDDLQTVVQDKKISYVRAVALEEQKKHRSGEVSPSPATRAHRTGIITSVIVLLLLGALAIGAVFYVASQRTPQATRPFSESFIFAESAVPFPLSGLKPPDVKRSLAQARAASGLTLGAITRIVPIVSEGADSESVERPATFEEFLSAMEVSAPDELYRAVSEEFFFGIHTVDENAPLIVVPVVSYERAFSSMLQWEKRMNADLTPLFTPIAALTVDENGLPAEREFEDILMRNYDVRALKNDDGTIELFYSFPTRNVLIIAESPYSFTEALSRLRAERRL